MTVEALVRHVVVIETVLTLVMVATLLIAGAYAQLATARRIHVREAVVRMMAAGIRGRPFPRDDAILVRSATQSHVIAALVDLGRHITGTSRAILREIASAGGVVAYAYETSRMSIWWRRLEGARLLALIGPTEADTRRMLVDA